MTNKYFVHINKLYKLDHYTIQFYPDRLTNNYDLHLKFSALVSPSLQAYTYIFNSMEDVLARLDTLNFNTLQYYRINHPELFI